MVPVKSGRHLALPATAAEDVRQTAAGDGSTLLTLTR